MEPFALFCKSYRNDVLRARKLAESVQRFNRDRLPFFLSVPQEDLLLFREKLAGIEHTLLADEEILAANPLHPVSLAKEMSGNHLQQVVKSEFWRLERCRNYLMIDSDSYFIRPFGVTDFMYDDQTPYTVMHEGKDLLQFAARSGSDKIKRNFVKDRAAAQALFGRSGRIYDFGPTPIICSCEVWKNIANRFASPSGKSFADLIALFPNEMLWYGEALLHYRTFPIFPVEPLFKVFHYRKQYEESLMLKETEKNFAENFLGIIKQSNWDITLDLVRRKKRSWRTLWLKR